jgi:CopG family nickel-responsive transcriptional regulator
VHLDHEHCLASVILRGATAEVRALADHIRGERGVRFGSLNLVTVELADRHRHMPGDQPHVHWSPKPG